jgi:hypothetical protein
MKPNATLKQKQIETLSGITDKRGSVRSDSTVNEDARFGPASRSNSSVSKNSVASQASTIKDTSRSVSSNSDSDSDNSNSRQTSPRSSSPRSSSPRSSSPRSPSRSRSSSSVNSEQPLIPVPIPKSDAVYESIKNKISKVKQKNTESIQFVPPKNISIGKREKTLPNYYLFVVLGEEIINFFESKINFKLGTTAGLPNNYIFSKESDFNSIFSFQNNSFIKDDAVTDTDDYTGIKSFAPIIKNTGVIEFYVYNSKSEPLNTYYTYGNLFIYEYGIASTCKIVLSSGKIPKQKPIILPHKNNSNEKILFLPSNYGKTLDKSKAIDDLISKIKTTVFGTTATLSMQQILIHYLNAISPEGLKTVLPNNWVDVVKILYVNISCMDEANAEPKSDADLKIDLKIDNYNRLHKYVNYYYKYKSENNSNNTRTIDEYINDDKDSYFSPFAMHIFDFFEFLMFLKNKTTTNEVNCCIEIYNFYIANYHDGFSNLSTKKDLITQLQQKMQEKQKKIYTYLQIIKDTPANNDKYEIQFNAARDTINPDTKNNEKTMKLIYKTKTASLKKPIFNTTTYKIGPFDKIYKPLLVSGNAYNEIVNEPSFQEIITKIQSGSPTMISFHGPIGSARTKMSRQVILSLCEKLAYPNLEISFQEFFKKHDDNPDDESSKLNKINLTLQESKYKITTTEIPKPYHSIKIEKNKLSIIKQGDSLESLLTYYFDTNRLTKRFSTYLDNANSFDSPRSHVLCFLKMTRGEEKPLYIIFDDLAGNETKYDCANENILSKFANFKNKEKSLFYENEFDSTGENFDFYNGGSAQTEMSKTKTLYNKLIKEACEHRAIEGDFINESLQQFRADLEYMVDVKNKDNKYYVPDIFVEQIDKESIKTCLQDFCFGKTACFGLKNIKEVKEPTSIVLKSVYTFLKDNLIIKSATDFYNNLEMCVFGVFNISSPHLALRSHLNEPPNYIGINKLKSIIYGKDEFTFNNNPGVFDAFKDALQKKTEYIKRLSALYSRFPENYVDKLIELCNNEFKPDVRGGNPITKLSLAQIETFKAVFDAIDDENAKTAIGTLEFMNKISKLNTVDSICDGINDSTNYAPDKF